MVTCSSCSSGAETNGLSLPDLLLVYFERIHAQPAVGDRWRRRNLPAARGCFPSQRCFQPPDLALAIRVEHHCGFLFSRYITSHRRRSERLFETVTGEQVFFRCETVRRDDFRERHSDPKGKCQDVLRGLHCLFDENDRPRANLAKRVFQADRSGGRRVRGGKE